MFEYEIIQSNFLILGSFGDKRKGKMSLITRPSIMKKDIISPKDKASNLKKKQINKDDDQRYTLQ